VQWVLLVLVVGGAAAIATASGATSDHSAVAAPMSATQLATHAASGAAVDATMAARTTTTTGRRVFLRDCAWCHGGSGQGTQFAPSLIGVGKADADFYLRTGRMPLKTPDQRVQRGPVAYDGTTIRALVAYVGSLGPGEPIPEVGPGDIAHGRSLFLYNCAPCHSSSGTGVIVSGGHVAPELFDTAPTQIAEAVRLGPGQMPEFTRGDLSTKEVNDIVSYVRELGPKQNIGGNGLDQYGPIAEMLFVFLVPIPILLGVIRLLGKKAPK
jgi:ubiquinol-cytochrome c reductase cytochrome c subunit